MWEKKVARLFNILGHLSPSSQITVEQLAKEYNVSKSAMEQDIETLLSAKLGVFCHEGKIQISSNGYKKIRSWLIS